MVEKIITLTTEMEDPETTAEEANNGEAAESRKEDAEEKWRADADKE